MFHPLSATLRSHPVGLTLKFDAFTIGEIGIATFGTIIVPHCGAAIDLRAIRQKCDCCLCGEHHMM
ncbi:hypothetical protein QWJ07_12425 [Frankia sp. RB7]|nr:hypothetical protein [Frankia sp. RB7]